MTAQHMIEHLSSALIMSLKNTIHHAQMSAEVLQKHKAHMLANGFKQGTSMGDGKLKDLKHPDLATAANQFSKNLADFFGAAATTDLATSHFYFGPLKNEEWRIFHYWHIHYHFEQFGII
jgi:hypothetical protein